MLNWITKNKNSKKGIVGVAASASGVAFAHLRAGEALEVTGCEYIKAQEQQVIIDRLGELVVSHNLKGLRCNAVLAPETYSILLSEVPNVPEDELRDAMRWRIKDLSPIPVDQAVVDVFRLPEDAGSVGKGMAFTVVAQQQAVENLVAIVQGAGLKMNAIDVPELCLRNIADLIAKPSRSIVVARLLDDGSHVTAICKGNVYLNRHFNFRYQGGAIPEAEVESLTLELQRSVDYIQHQMRQPAPSDILLLGRALLDEHIPPSLDASLAADVKVLTMSNYLAVPAGTDIDTIGRCTIAMGAALRDVGVPAATEEVA